MDADVIHLHRHDPSRNMARFYDLRIEPSLFGDWMVIRSWGRIGTAGQRRIELHAGLLGARAAVTTLLRQKTRRGYHPA